MTRCTCPFVLIALLMISTNSADDGISCYFCQNTECLKNKPSKLMDCSTERMSSKNLVGDAKIVWDLILKGSTDLDDTSKYTKCVRLRWRNSADAENRCYFCQNAECLKNKPPELMDCSTEKMSSNLVGNGKEMWDSLVEGNHKFDDPAKYTKCVKIEYRDERLESERYLSGCAPDMDGEKDYCDYAREKLWKQLSPNFTIRRCVICQPGETNCSSYPLFEAEKSCYRCDTRDCFSVQMDCLNEKMSSYNWTGRSKEMWNLLSAGGAELDDPTEYTICAQLDWKNAEGKRSYIWGCAPKMVGKEEYCDYVNKTSIANRYTLLDCNTCWSWGNPCVTDARVKKWAKCYMSQKRDKLGPPKIMDCHNERMSLANLTGEAKKMWDLLTVGRQELDDIWKYDGHECFAMSWEHGTGSSFLAGCSPIFVGVLFFCDHVMDILAENNYISSSCDFAPAEEEPSFFVTWEKPRKCYVCSDSDCLKPSKMINCLRDEMIFHVLGNDDVYDFWDSVYRTVESNLSYYNQCFGIAWGKNTLWGCGPEYVGDKKFCDFANKMVGMKVQCNTCTATEKPCLYPYSSSATILHDHAVFCLIISYVLLKMMFLFYINIL